MDSISAFANYLATAPVWQVLGIIFIVNVLEIAFVLVAGDWLVRRFKDKRIAPHPTKASRTETVLTLLTLLLNTLITLLGYYLWLNGYIVIQHGSLFSMFVDMVAFILFIDLSMYALHRLAHWRPVFPWLHGTHHLYENPRPLTLFVLNPMETLSFGFLWLFILFIYKASWPGVVLFLTFNLLFGMIGHLGVEPLPKGRMGWLFSQIFSTSTFHAKHHKNRHYNFGFYLVLWDRLLGTLHPGYWSNLMK